MDPWKTSCIRSAAAAAALALAAALASTGVAQPGAPTPIAEDGAVTVGGVEAACTGIGQTRDDPRWTAYPVRVEVSDAKNDYLAGAIVSVFDKAGRPLLSVSCEDPWILLKLRPGTYKVYATLMNSAAKPRSAVIRAPASGRIRVVLQFPDA